MGYLVAHAGGTNRQLPFTSTALVVQTSSLSFSHSFSSPFSSGDCCEGSSPRRTRNNSWFSAISDTFAGFTPRWDQAKSETQSFHMVLGRPLAAFPWVQPAQDLAC